MKTVNRFKCIECNELTGDSFYREDENETVCEDCWIEFLLEFTSTNINDLNGNKIGSFQCKV